MTQTSTVPVSFTLYRIVNVFYEAISGALGQLQSLAPGHLGHAVHELHARLPQTREVHGAQLEDHAALGTNGPTYIQIDK